MVKFVRLKLGSHKVVHGYDAQNREITEDVPAERFSDKVVALNRIQSIGEKYVLMKYADGRWIYWEYEGGLEHLMLKLEAAGVLIS